MNVRAIGIGAVGLIAAAIACGIDRGIAQEKVEQKVETIPLKDTYQSFGGEGKYVWSLGTVIKKHRIPLQRGVPCITDAFLVRGKDIEAAMIATVEVMREGKSADIATGPASDKDAKRVWAVAFLGIDGSSPAAWRVQSVQRRVHEIRITVKEGQPETRDSIAYFIWVSIGELLPGTYTVTLFDAGCSDSFMRRRVIVGKQ